MDTKFFVSRRKARGLSQAVLCEGICTQSTLSKFENNGKVPSLAILGQLCRRLGLTIDDLNDDDVQAVRHVRASLDKIEEAMMAEHFPQAIKQLAGMKPAAMTAPRPRCAITTCRE